MTGEAACAWVDEATSSRIDKATSDSVDEAVGGWVDEANTSVDEKASDWVDKAACVWVEVATQALHAATRITVATTSTFIKLHRPMVLCYLEVNMIYLSGSISVPTSQSLTRLLGRCSSRPQSLNAALRSLT